MRPLLIIGYGNSLRSDDGLGWHVSQELLRTIDSAAVEIISCGQLTPDLAEPISHAGQVLFIDVARSGPPGEVICKRVTPASAAAAFSHQLSAEGLLGITRVPFWRLSGGESVLNCGPLFRVWRLCVAPSGGLHASIAFSH